MIIKQILQNKRKIIIGIIGLAAAFSLLTYRLEEVPMGLSVDESSLGYNAILLSKTLHDQNDRFLPFFVLTVNGRDWKQPVMAYSIAGLFKIIPPTQYSLRLGGVIVAMISLCLIYLFISRLFNSKFGLIGCLLFISVPIIMIQSHIAHENIMPLPFVLTWLISLLVYEKKMSWKYLVLAGLSLGAGFYSYKSMRLIVAVWSVLSCLYLIYSQYSKDHRRRLVSILTPAIIFSLSILPFFAITPWLEFKYAGAVFDNKSTNFRYFYDFFFPYLSSFDPAYMFIKGDITIWHSTDRHGMFLLTTLPLFIIGCYQAIRRRGFWVFIIISFFTAPLLFGFVDSIHRFSRLLALIPSFVALSTLGIYTLLDSKPKILFRIMLGVIVVLSIFNYYDFINYYWFDYAKFSRSSFSPDVHLSYETLAKLAKNNQLTPYIDSYICESDSEDSQFFETAYFGKPLKRWQAEEPLPNGSILMTPLEAQPHLKTIDFNLPPFHFLINENQELKIE
jgi:hypothetical protein